MSETLLPENENELQRALWTGVKCIQPDSRFLEECKRLKASYPKIIERIWFDEEQELHRRLLIALEKNLKS